MPSLSSVIFAYICSWQQPKNGHLRERNWLNISVRDTSVTGSWPHYGHLRERESKVSQKQVAELHLWLDGCLREREAKPTKNWWQRIVEAELACIATGEQYEGLTGL